ncbi:MAG: hypothetical protein PHW96_04100 [Candidatus Nanoarchaeia archaeon]|nr:hypothetical protein [Candidatus Nanoarchaeia archaeon]
MAEEQKPQQNPLAFISQKLSEVSRRVRILEEKTNSISDKISITDSTLLKNTQAFREDITEINISIKELTKELETLKETSRRVIKQMDMFVLKRDFSVLEKYIDIINPTKMMSKEDIVKIVRDELRGIKQ